MSVPRLLQADIASAIRNHGEEVTYHPAAGGELVFRVVIQRSEPRRAFASPSGALAHTITLLVRRSDDSALGVESITAPGDQVTMPLRYGEEPVRCRVTSIASSNPGFFRIQVAR